LVEENRYDLLDLFGPQVRVICRQGLQKFRSNHLYLPPDPRWARSPVGRIPTSCHPFRLERRQIGDRKRLIARQKAAAQSVREQMLDEKPGEVRRVRRRAAAMPD